MSYDKLSLLWMYPCDCFHLRVTDDGVQTRAHLETQLAASLALKSSQEYRQCLLSYIRFLARLAHYILFSASVQILLSRLLAFSVSMNFICSNWLRDVFLEQYHLCWNACCACREADESRLREVCESFLGPPMGMVGAVSTDANNPSWDPDVLVRLLFC